MTAAEKSGTGASDALSPAASTMPPSAPSAPSDATPDDPPATSADTAPSTPLEEVDRRLAALREDLAAAGLDAALLHQNADLYYYAGTVQQSFLYVPASGPATLFMRRVVERARAESPLAQVVALRSMRGLGDAVRERYGALPERLGLELDVLPVALFRRLESQFPGAWTEDISGTVRRRRAVKSPHEVGLIRAAAGITDEVCERIPQLLHEGVRENQLAGRLEAIARAFGHEGVIRMRGFNQEMFYGQFVSGPNGTVPSYPDTPLAGEGLSPAVAQGVTARSIGRGEPVVFDFVSVRRGYIADFTRVFSLGPLPDACRRAFAVALEIEQKVAAVARPGVECAELYRLALGLAEAAGLGDRFMGTGEMRARFVGHGVGLELDELPVIAAIDEPLADGMVFALEPKFVLPGVGAVGIEDTFVVTPGGAERLSGIAPRLFEI